MSVQDEVAQSRKSEDVSLLPDDLAKQLTDPAFWAHEPSIHNLLSNIRANYPVSIASMPGFRPFWIVSKYSDIMEISRQNNLFHSGDLSAMLQPEEEHQKLSGSGKEAEKVHRSIVFMDPPEHGRYRMLTQAWFQPGNVKKREEEIRIIAKKAVERMRAAGGTCDFVSDIAVHYPLEVIMNILGIPDEHYARVLRLTQEVFGPADEDLGRDGEDTFALGSENVFRDFNAFLRPFHEDRRANPRDDVLTIIANAQINGEPIPEIEGLSYSITVATAGHDTTASTSSTAMWALSQSPELFREIKDNPTLVPALIEESLRWTSPVRHFMRSATADYELRGQKIHKGDWLMLCYPSGNRDEEIFTNPQHFRLDRPANKQIAFGYGAHVCLGQHLAKLEMRILFEELIASLDSIEPAGEPQYAKAVFVGGLKSLPIKYQMA
jgi:cytochrome P450